MSNTTVTLIEAENLDAAVQVVNLRDIPEFWFEVKVSEPGSRRLYWLSDFWEGNGKYTRQPNYCSYSFTKRNMYSHASSQRCLDIYLDAV